MSVWQNTFLPVVTAVLDGHPGIKKGQVRKVATDACEVVEAQLNEVYDALEAESREADRLDAIVTRIAEYATQIVECGHRAGDVRPQELAAEILELL